MFPFRTSRSVALDEPVILETGAFTSPEIIEVRLANAVAWFCGVVNYFDDLPFTDTFAGKYGKMKCPYCEERYCLCEPGWRPELKNPPFETMTTDGEHKKLLSWWCYHFETMYGKRNQNDGIYRVIAHLTEEVQEVLALTALTAYKPNNLNELEREFALELADVFAHLIAIANFKKVDLAATIEKHYGQGCPICRTKPCQCPRLMIVKDVVQRIGSE